MVSVREDFVFEADGVTGREAGGAAGDSVNSIEPSCAGGAELVEAVCEDPTGGTAKILAISFE